MSEQVHEEDHEQEPERDRHGHVTQPNSQLPMVMIKRDCTYAQIAKLMTAWWHWGVPDRQQRAWLHALGFPGLASIQGTSTAWMSAEDHAYKRRFEITLMQRVTHGQDF